jgi:hypothetical protein
VCAVLQLIPEFTKAFESRGGVQTTELQSHHKVIVTAPTAVDMNAHLSEDSMQNSLLTTLETELKELSRSVVRAVPVEVPLERSSDHGILTPV